MNSHRKYQCKLQPSNQDGFVLVLSMLIMIVLIVVGVTAMKTSKTELYIAGNEKFAKISFYQAESGSYNESVRVGASTSPYQVSDPSDPNQILSTTDRKFDKSNPTENVKLWQYGNYSTDNYYSLVTYLHAGTAPKGYDASKFTVYKFKIDGAPDPGDSKVVKVIEVGGNKIGVKISM